MKTIRRFFNAIYTLQPNSHIRLKSNWKSMNDAISKSKVKELKTL